MSYFVRSRTYRQGDRKVNVGKVKIKIVGSGYEYVELSYYETEQMQAKVKPSGFSTAKNKTVLSKKVRWYSSNTNIARVDKNGRILSQAKEGECYIFTRAHNGKKSNKIKVIVNNYAKPKKRTMNLWAASQDPEKYGQVLEMFSGYYSDVTDIAEYFSKARLNERQTFECWMKDGKVEMTADEYLSTEIKRKIQKFVPKFPYDVKITATSEFVAFSELGDLVGDNKKAVMNVVYLFDKTKLNPYAYVEKYTLDTNWVYGYLAKR